MTLLKVYLVPALGDEFRDPEPMPISDENERCVPVATCIPGHFDRTVLQKLATGGGAEAPPGHS